MAMMLARSPSTPKPCKNRLRTIFFSPRSPCRGQWAAPFLSYSVRRQEKSELAHRPFEKNRSDGFAARPVVDAFAKSGAAAEFGESVAVCAGLHDHQRARQNFSIVGAGSFAGRGQQFFTRETRNQFGGAFGVLRNANDLGRCCYFSSSSSSGSSSSSSSSSASKSSRSSSHAAIASSSPSGRSSTSTGISTVSLFLKAGPNLGHTSACAFRLDSASASVLPKKTCATRISPSLSILKL